MRNRFILLLAAAALTGCTARSNAQFTFTDFSQSSGSDLVVTNTGGVASSFPLSLTIGSGAGTFVVVNNTPLAAALYAAYATDLGLGSPASIAFSANISSNTATTNVPATGTTSLDQPIANGTQFSFDITLQTAMNSHPAGTVILHGSSVLSRFDGVVGSNSTTFSASDLLGDGTDFTSALPDVNNILQSGLNHAFSFTTSNYNSNTAGTGIQLDTTNNFVASGHGQYTAIFSVQQEVPEPGALSLLFGSGIGGSLLMLRRRRRA